MDSRFATSSDFCTTSWPSVKMSSMWDGFDTAVDDQQAALAYKIRI